MLNILFCVFSNLFTQYKRICISISTDYHILSTHFVQTQTNYSHMLNLKYKKFLSHINTNNHFCPNSFIIYSNFWNFLIITFMKWVWVRTKKKFPIILTQEIGEWIIIIILFLIKNIFCILIYFLMMAFSGRHWSCLDICVDAYCKAEVHID